MKKNTKQVKINLQIRNSVQLFENLNVVCLFQYLFIKIKNNKKQVLLKHQLRNSVLVWKLKCCLFVSKFIHKSEKHRTNLFAYSEPDPQLFFIKSVKCTLVTTQYNWTGLYNEQIWGDTKQLHWFHALTVEF